MGEDKATDKGTGKRRVHRVGTITFGMMLILFGGLFLAHLFLPALDYLTIFHCWPLILVCLGIEVLAASMDRHTAFTYDKAAVFLMVLLVVFSMCMAGADIMLRYAEAECAAHRIVIW